MDSREYVTDLTDEQWQLIRQWIPARKRMGRKPISRREVINAILYLVHSGCQWRMLPSSFPNWNTVYGVFRQWKKDGIWERIHEALRRRVRQASGKSSSPTVAIVDSQSIRTAEGGEERGFDAGKKVTGRKRHLAVDTLGLMLAVVVHGAYWQDHDGAVFVLHKLKDRFRRLKVVFADVAYGRNGLPEWTKQTFGWLLQTILRPVRQKTFVVLPKRWIIERTFAWIIRARRNSRDYEKTTESSEAIIQITMIRLMLRRLVPIKS